MSPAKNNLIEFEGFHLDLAERTLWRDSEMIPLAPKVLETLCVLVENRGRLIPKTELMEKVWPDSFVEERNLTQNIFVLRKMLGSGREGRPLIETVPRRGYRFTAEVCAVPGEIEETFAVTHSRQMHITAEGSVSQKELTNTVREIARSFGPDDNPILESRPKRRITPALAIALAVLGLGIAGWGLRNDFSGLLTTLAISDKAPVLVSYELLTESGDAFFPSISPDNQYVAYVLNEKGKFSVMLQHLPTRSTTEVVSPKSYEVRSPQFSRDGHHLYFAARDGKRESTIYKMPIFGGDQRQIATGAVQNFSISPDGTQIAFFRHDSGIDATHLVIASADGTNERTVATHRDKTAFRVWGAFPGWSPDGKKIVASIRNIIPDNSNPQRSYFVEIDLKDGREQRIPSPNWEVCFQAYWLADGSGLIAQAQETADSFFRLWHLSYPEGKTRLITNDTNNYTEFQLSADGTNIVTSEETTPYNLQLISLEAPDRVRSLTDSVATQRGYLGLDWTPDGKTLVYLQLEGLTAGNIWKMDTESGDATQLTFDHGVINRNPDVTPDGKSIVFLSTRSGDWHIWQIDIDGSNPIQITDGIGESVPHVSPDGDWLLYATPGERPTTLWKRPLAGGEPVKLLENSGGTSSVSPDMKHVVVNYYDPAERIKDRWKYGLLPFDGGHLPRDTGISTQHHTIKWKPDASGFYFLSRGQSNTNVWFYSLADGRPSPVTNFDSHEIVGLSVSPDGKTLAIARGKKSSNLFKITGF